MAEKRKRQLFPLKEYVNIIESHSVWKKELNVPNEIDIASFMFNFIVKDHNKCLKLSKEINMSPDRKVFQPDYRVSDEAVYTAI